MEKNKLTPSEKLVLKIINEYYINKPKMKFRRKMINKLIEKYLLSDRSYNRSDLKKYYELKRELKALSIRYGVTITIYKSKHMIYVSTFGLTTDLAFNSDKIDQSYAGAWIQHCK